MGVNVNNPSERDIIIGSKPGHLYSHEFDKGRFFQVVFQDETSVNIKLAPRTMLKIVYVKEMDDIEGLHIIKLIDEKESQRVSFSKFNLAQLKVFLDFICSIDLKGIAERRLKLETEDRLDLDTIRKIKTLLYHKGGGEIIEQFIDEGIITTKDIVNTAFRKKGLDIFQQMLSSQDYWKQYSINNGLRVQSEEKAWQYFFEKNEWIFGYGLDYKFQGILQREFHASDTFADGSNGVITDFLLGDKRFTTFVEIKKPSTPLFKGTQNRSRSWSLSTELFESVSQILEQKVSGQQKVDSKTLYDQNGQTIVQQAYDSKVILLIGNWQQLTGLSPLESDIKKRTLELFRRDSRNIEIITFDELFDRARFIAYHNTRSQDKHEKNEGDLPF